MAVSASAGQLSSSDSLRNVAAVPTEPPFTGDLRLRNPRGGLRLELLQPPSATDNTGPIVAPDVRALPHEKPTARPVPDSRSITPLGDGEAYALRGKRGPQILSLAPMPIVDGVEIDPKMPMKTPDPTVDYKLHVREMTPPASGDTKK